jgi:tetratricopeptide (TPR) repeat protein/predicted AlkP superfamily phosphohydrolase/phosphomutase
MSRSRIAILAALLAGVGYAAVSVRSVPRDDRVHVVEYPLLRSRPGILEPGRHFLPRLLVRISAYPASPTRLRVELAGENAAKSREGAKVEVEADLTYAVPREHLLRLHADQGPRFAEGWLAGLLRRETRERIAAVSYDVVRNRDPELAGGILGALREQTAGAGLEITSLRVVQIAGVGEASGAIRKAEAGPIDREVVVIGVDSFDWRILDPLIRQGRVPHLARLVERGTRANLKTIRPILSPVIWTSIATGVKPSRHGIADFVVAARDSGELVPVTSSMRLTPALWTLLGRQGVEVSVVAWWATWPAETVRGNLVTDRIAFQLFDRGRPKDWKGGDPDRDRGKTHPPGLLEEIRPLIRVPTEVADSEVASFLPGGRFPADLDPARRELLDRFRTVIAAGETYHAIARRLFARSGKGLKMVYYEGPDTASHLFMHYRPPLLAGIAKADSDLFGGIVDRYYERQDRYLGEILESVGKDATVILVSDHGFKTGAGRPPHSSPDVETGNAADWHTPIGVLVMAGPDVRSGAEIGSASVLDITATVLALFGLPVPRDGDGQPLAAALEAEFLGRHPIRWIDTYGGVRPPPVAGDVVAQEGDAELIEKLRSLGYIGEERLAASNNRGVMALDEGDVEGAIGEFRRAIAGGGPGGTMARTNLARALLLRGDLEQARAEAETALREEPANKQAHLILSGVAVREGDLRGAEAQLRKALEIDPAFALAHSKLGEALQKQGRDDEALAAFRKAVEIAPLSPVELNAIGNLLRKRGEIDHAEEAYREALRCDAQFLGAYNNLGLILQERGRREEALALYEKALAIRPENPILRNSLGTLLAAQGRREEAIAEFERAVQSDATWPVARGNLATMLFESGRFERALGEFRKWSELEPESVEARLGLGLALLMTQERGEARVVFEEVLRAEPDNLRAHIALGETLLREGDLEGAQRHLERASRLGGDVARIHASLGEVYLRRGLRKEAAREFRRSLEIEPDQETIRRRLAEAAGSPPT